MSNPSQWQRLKAHRRRMSGEPDEATITRCIETWRLRLADPSSDHDADLDRELVNLLEKIHHAF